MTPLADVNSPGSQEDLVSNWEPARSLVEDASLGPRLPLFGSGCHPPASLPLVGDGPVCSQLALLWYLLSPFFCEQAWQCLRLELFFCLSLFPLSLSLSVPQFGLLSHVSSLRLSSGHSGPVLILSTNYAAFTSLSSSCWLVANASVWDTFPLAVVFR